MTADRPLRLRGTSASQTTDQVGILPRPPLRRRRGPRPALEVGVGSGPTVAPQRPARRPAGARGRVGRPGDHGRGEAPDPGRQVEIPHGPRTVVIAGDDAGPPARVLAERAQWPLFAEPTSGSRTGTHALRTYRLLLDGDLGDADRARRRRRAPDALAADQPPARPRRRRGLGRRGRRALARPAVRRRPRRRPGHDRRSRPTPCGSTQWRDGRPRRRPPARRAAAGGGRPDAVRSGRCREPRAARRRAAVRRRLQPDPRPRPDGGALRGRRPPQGDRQPRPRRHRRHRLQRDRRRARSTAQQPGARADGRRDLPARHDRPGPRPARGSAPT